MITSKKSLRALRRLLIVLGILTPCDNSDKL